MLAFYVFAFIVSCVIAAVMFGIEKAISWFFGLGVTNIEAFVSVVGIPVITSIVCIMML